MLTKQQVNKSVEGTRVESKKDQAAIFLLEVHYKPDKYFLLIREDFEMSNKPTQRQKSTCDVQTSSGHKLGMHPLFLSVNNMYNKDQ